MKTLPAQILAHRAGPQWRNTRLVLRFVLALAARFPAALRVSAAPPGRAPRGEPT